MGSTSRGVPSPWSVLCTTFVGRVDLEDEFLS